MYNEGISKIGDLIDLAVEKEIIKKSGAWFSYGENRMQGRDGVKRFLQDDSVILEKLGKEVRAAIGMDNGAENGVSGNGIAKEDASVKKK